MSILIVYHSFPHYRSGVIEELKKIPGKFVFLGGKEETEGILNYRFDKVDSFISVVNIRLFGFLIQPRVIWECMFGTYEAYVFLANPNHISTWIGGLACRVRGRRVIFWGHGIKSATWSMKNMVRVLFFRIAHGFYTYGWRAKVNAETLGFASQTLYVGFNSLDYKRQIKLRNALTSARHEANVPPGLRLCCISRLTADCRYDILFRAMAALKADISSKDVQVTLIGDGAERDRLAALSKSLDITVEFVGAMYDEEKIGRLLYDADVVVSPGKVGLTAMHSMMYGTPVISHDDFVSQMPEVEAIVAGYTGLLFKKDNVVDLTEKLRYFKTYFPNRGLTRQRCFKMMDELYNPAKQAEILNMAIQNIAAPDGNDAFVLFDGDRGA